MNRTFISLLVVLIVLQLFCYTLYGFLFPSADIMEMKEITESESLSKDQKVEKIKQHFSKGTYIPSVLYYLHQVDRSAAKNSALDLFRDKKINRKNKLKVGEFLLQRYESDDFIDEYGVFIVNAVLSGGVEEFCREREREISAIGEYVFIASDFGGHSSKNFEKIKDKRTIPILIKALDAPDNIYGKHQGCDVRGEPGESTCRNVQRQQIPIALAKLNAVESIDKLEHILFTHHDHYLRKNSSYALAYLMDRNDSRRLETKMKEKDVRYLISFGRGLLAKGNSDGLAYIKINFNSEIDNLHSVLYKTKQLLLQVKIVKDRKIESFYRDLLNQEPLVSIFSFEISKIKFHEITITSGKQGEILSREESRIIDVYKTILNGLSTNNLTNLTPIIKKIGETSHNKEIKKLTNEFLANSLKE